MITSRSSCLLTLLASLANPCVGNGAELRVLAFGDGGTGTETQYGVASAMLRVCKEKGCDLAIMLGDNIYEHGVNSVEDAQFVTKFEKPYGALKIPFYVSIGNHDERGDTQAQLDYTKRSQWWKMPARYYDFIVDQVHFFAIDSNDFDSQQKRWLKSSLSDSRAKWKVVFGHHPIRSHGAHGDTGRLVDHLLPLICEFGSIYVSGHDHDLQVLRSQCGVPLVVSGAAAKLRRTSFGKNSLFAQSTHGFVRLVFGKLHFTVRVYDMKARLLYANEFGGKRNDDELVYRNVDGQRTVLCAKQELVQGGRYDGVGDDHIVGIYCRRHPELSSESERVPVQVARLKGARYDVFCEEDDQAVVGVDYKDGGDDHLEGLYCQSVDKLVRHQTYFRNSSHAKNIDVRCDHLEDIVVGVRFKDRLDRHIEGIYCQRRRGSSPTMRPH